MSSENDSLNDRSFEGELLPAFPATPTEAWHAKIEGDLGEDWQQRLAWDAGADLDLLPFYREEDLEDVPTGVPDARPGWQLRQDLPSGKAEDVRRALDGGADALGLPAAVTASDDAFRDILREIDLGETPLHLDGTPSAARLYFEEAERQDAEPRGSLCFDPAARLARRPDDFDAEAAYDRLAALLQETESTAPAFRLVTADARPFHDAGAGPVEALALALAALNEHFARLTERGCSPQAVAESAQVVLPVGTRFFVEIARLRALRRLAAQVVEAYDADARLQVQAVTARRPLTLYDPHLNLLRAATGAAAAVLGGADVLAVQPFDAAQKEQSDFARRLARNTQHLLRTEAHLGRTADPAAGSYYAEILTDKLARRAWERFQQIEADGGLLNALRSGSVQESLAGAREERHNALARRERVRVGTNHYPNLDETRLDDAPKNEPKNEPDANDSLPARRETEAFEHLRLRTERYAKQHSTERPSFLLLPVGTPKVRSARANFARNALGCAGFRPEATPLGFDAPEDAVRAAAESDAEIIAACAPDDDYAALLPALRDALDDALDDAGSNALLVVAGAPDALDSTVRDAADAFVHRGMNLLETLEAIQKRLL